MLTVIAHTGSKTMLQPAHVDTTPLHVGANFHKCHEEINGSAMAHMQTGARTENAWSNTNIIASKPVPQWAHTHTHRPFPDVSLA